MRLPEIRHGTQQEISIAQEIRRSAIKYIDNLSIKHAEYCEYIEIILNTVSAQEWISNNGNHIREMIDKFKYDIEKSDSAAQEIFRKTALDK